MILEAIDEVARQWIFGADAKYTLEQAAEQVTTTLINGILVN